MTTFILIHKIIPDMIKSIREELRVKYHTDDIASKHYQFRGLCDIASTMLVKKIDQYEEIHRIGLFVYSVHGEMAHTPRLKSSNWIYQHTIVIVEYQNQIIYADPTSQQFNDLYPDIPNYFVTTKKPKWYYLDKDNPAWYRSSMRWQDTIQFFQFRIWGTISDIIYRLRKK